MLNLRKITRAEGIGPSLFRSIIQNLKQHSRNWLRSCGKNDILPSSVVGVLDPWTYVKDKQVGYIAIFEHFSSVGFFLLPRKSLAHQPAGIPRRGRCRKPLGVIWN